LTPIWREITTFFAEGRGIEKGVEVMELLMQESDMMAGRKRSVVQMRLQYKLEVSHKNKEQKNEKLTKRLHLIRFCYKAV